LQWDDYKLTLSKQFTSGIVFDFPLLLLHLAAGEEKEECDQDKAQAKLLTEAKVDGDICVTLQ